MDEISRVCVLIPFKGRAQQLRRCLDAVLPQLSDRVHLLLIDDGSDPDPLAAPPLADVPGHPHVDIVRHGVNRGVSAARCTGIEWCRKRAFDIVLMIDSDCVAPADHVAKHLALHRKYPEAAVIGGAIRGVGHTLWARLDGMMTWFHVVPGSPERVLPAPYVAPTANLSVKLAALPFDDGLFDPRLRTGEDSAFSRRVRAAGQHIVFSPTIEIEHADRNAFADVLRHQYEFGRHHYYVGHVDAGLGRFCFRPWYRALFLCCFAVGLPLYALYGCWLNMRPWLRHDVRRAAYWPLLQLFWLAKGVAVLEAAASTRTAFRMDR